MLSFLKKQKQKNTQDPGRNHSLAKNAFSGTQHVESPQAQLCEKCECVCVCVCVCVCFKLLFVLCKKKMILGILAVNLMHDNYG